MRWRHNRTVDSIEAGSCAIRTMLAAAAISVMISCGGKADANEMAMDTAFLRDTAAGEVVLDSLGRPIPIYREDKSESSALIKSDTERASVSSRDDDDDRPRRRGKKEKKHGKRRD
jgi:hypothetical protein